MPIWEVHWKIVRTFEATPLGKYFDQKGERGSVQSGWFLTKKERKMGLIERKET